MHEDNVEFHKKLSLKTKKNSFKETSAKENDRLKGTKTVSSDRDALMRTKSNDWAERTKNCGSKKSAIAETACQQIRPESFNARKKT